MTDRPPTSADRSSRDHSDSEPVLRRVLEALGPYREDLILIGGWVPYLYQQFGGFPTWQIAIARTIELDLVVPAELETGLRPPLSKILADAGFSASSGNEGAVWVADEADDEMIDFFTPHQGTARQIGRPRRIRGQASLVAISLTHLPLLVDETRTLAIATRRSASLTVRVPTLGGYLLNKALTFTERLSSADSGIGKAAKDIVYMRDVTAGGEDVRDQVRKDILLLVKGNKSRTGLVTTALQRVHDLTAVRSKVLDAAVEQIAEHHRFSSEGAAKADLLGHMEMLRDLLDEIGQRRRRRS